MANLFSSGTNRKVTGKAADARPQAGVQSATGARATALGASNSSYTGSKTASSLPRVQLLSLQTTTQNLGAIGTIKQVTGKAADSGYTPAKKQASQAENRQTVSNYTNMLAQDTKLNFGGGTSRAKTQHHPALESKLG